MSRKLSTTIKDSKVPGKYKRVLEAYAAFANNDGTNIYPTKKKLAAKAGAAAPDTIYRNTPDLIDSGLLVYGVTHTCRVESCSKGRFHFTGHQGKYTTVYNIQIENLQNAERYLSAKCLRVNAAKSRKVLAAKCGTDSGIKETPAPAAPTLGTNPTLPQVPCGDREQESSSPARALAPLEERGGTPPAPPVVWGVGSEDKDKTQNQNPEPEDPHFASDIQERFHCEDIFTPEGYLLRSIFPKPSVAWIEKGLPLCRQIIAHFSDVEGKWRGVAAELVLKYNRSHRGQKYATKEDRAMYIRTPQQYLSALESDNATLLNEYLTHEFSECDLCCEAGTLDYRVFVSERARKEREQEEQRIAEAARRKEAERKAKLCAKCEKYPYGSMLLEDGKDRFNNAIMVKVCDGCYDAAYEFRLNFPGTRINLLPKRTGYKPPKFDMRLSPTEDPKAMADWFAKFGKVGEWSTDRKEREALGADNDHLFRVIRYLKKNQEKVTREQFLALLVECAAERPRSAEMAAAADGMTL